MGREPDLEHGMCGDELCRSNNPSSYCKMNGVCHGDDTPCLCGNPSPGPMPQPVSPSPMKTPTVAPSMVPTPVPTLPPSDAPVEAKYLAVKKAIYVWNTGDPDSHPWWSWHARDIALLVSACQAHNFTRA